ncbi:MAG: ERAP1-like C-terminal domain-containing protein, partial [Rhodoglobus sp.]
EKDNTANGQQAAARARATIPTAAGKRAALESALTDDAIPNTVLRNMGVGFQHVNEPGVLADLVEPYFESLTRIWKERSYKIAEYVIVGFFPAALASPQLVARAKAWLEANPEFPALRRLVIEELAGVERALKARERDLH